MPKTIPFAALAWALAALPALADDLDVRSSAGFIQLRESFPAGGSLGSVALVPAVGLGLTWRRPDGWGLRATADQLDPYAFTDADLPASVHLRTERRASLVGRYGFATGRLDHELSLGAWGRWVDVLNSFAAPGPSFMFSAAQTYLAPELGYRLEGDIAGDWREYVAIDARPAIWCFLDAGVTGPGWLSGMAGEAGARYAVGALSVNLGVTSQAVIGAPGLFWAEWGPKVALAYQL